LKNHKHIHCLFALLVSLSGFLIYLRTVAPTTSLWDCGEFIACSYILGVPHPPGAPLYLLLGRLFTMIPFAKDIGLRVNMISVIASTFTVLFTYLIIVRLIKTWRSTPKTGGDWLILYLSGMVGALVFAFTDSQWFNAVEAEVYAISMFFTSAVVWLIMVWAEKSDHPTSDRYLVMIGYCIGLAIGVHLLNILTLPFVFLIIYFKKFKIQSIWKFMASGLLGLITLLGLMAAGGFFKLSILGLLIHIGIHYYYLKKQSREEKEQHPYFRLALTMGIGFLIFLTIYPGIIKGIPVLTNQYGFGILGLTILVLMGLIIFSMIYRKRTWLLASMILFLMIMGYSTYTTIFIRSGMDPAIDENDPETTERMVKYLNREQYGSWSVLPRRYPNIPRKLEFQKRFPQKSYAFHDFSKQMRFFWNYQLKKMYIRYFGWQFIGKGKELDDDGNIKANLSLFGLYGLPFLIGLLGMIYHFSRDWKRAFSILSLFIMTGLAIVVYLNQPDPQPRERDYVYVASFFAFSLWIGIGSASLLDKINHGLETHRPLKHTIMVLLSLLLLGLIPLVLMTNFNSHNRKGNWMATNFAENLLNTCEPNSILFTNGDNDTFPLWFVQEVNNVRKDIRVVNLSLLNTDWYIKQLRDIPPEIPIHLKDETIDKIRLIPWKEKNVIIRVPEAVRNRIEESVPLKESTYAFCKTSGLVS